MQLNASRIKVLQAQDDVVNSMKEVASKELLNVSRDHHTYRNLLKDLIVQVSIAHSSIDIPYFTNKVLSVVCIFIQLKIKFVKGF